MRIAVDAMGGDHAPHAEIDGAIAAAKGGAAIVLVGDETRLREELKRRGVTGLPIEVQHATQVVTMDEHPSSAFKRKPNSSMRVCFDLVKNGGAGALVSAGNSGAMLACGLFVLGRIAGVDRPGIVTTFPIPDGLCALLDMGANVDIRPQNLVQFAVLGALYAQTLHQKPRPRVGVLSNGAEEHKGTDTTREADRRLRTAKTPDFEYVGYVEGRDIFSGRVDVVTTDGFTGNVLLKTAEGTAQAIARMLREAIEAHALGKLGGLLLRPAFREMKRKLDWAEYGGAPLLGVKGVAMICHGASPPRAIEKTILGARTFVEAGLSSKLEDAIGKHRGLWAEEPPSQPEVESRKA
jgi:glycerol-3-phosphate acyltransferase PlsX